MPYAPGTIHWVVAILFVLHWFCQRSGFCAGNVFAWLFFWLKYGWQMISCRQFFRCLFCEIVWLQPGLFLSLAFIILLQAKALNFSQF